MTVEIKLKWQFNFKTIRIVQECLETSNLHSVTHIHLDLGLDCRTKQPGKESRERKQRYIGRQGEYGLQDVDTVMLTYKTRDNGIHLCTEEVA